MLELEEEDLKPECIKTTVCFGRTQTLHEPKSWYGCLLFERPDPECTGAQVIHPKRAGSVASSCNFPLNPL